MKTVSAVFCLGLLVLASSRAVAQVVLQNFTHVADGVNTFYYGSWEATGSPSGSVLPNANFSQGPDYYTIGGSTGLVPTNNADSYIEFFYYTTAGDPARANIGDSNSLSVTAEIMAGNAAPSFTVTLQDSASRTATATFLTSAFSGGSFSTQTISLTKSNGFDATQIDSLQISGKLPSGTSAFDIAFGNISAVNVTAVPEPDAYALLIGVLSGAWIIIKRGRPPSKTNNAFGKRIG